MITMYLNRTFLLAISAIVFFGCGDSGDQLVEEDGGAEPVTLTENEEELLGAGNAFAFDFFRAVNENRVQENTFVSPLSLSMLVGMVLNGAHGETADDIEAALGLDGHTMEEINQGYMTIRRYLPELDPDVKVKMADSIWYLGAAPGEAFLSSCEQYFDAEVAPLDLAAINEWVDEATEGTIEEICLSPETSFAMIDAIYFKGAWTFKFEAVVDKHFSLDDGTEISVPMMSDAMEVDMFDLADSHGVRLPYGSGKYAMTIIVPGYPTSVDDFAASFDEGVWEDIQGAMEAVDNNVSIPEFELDFRESLLGILPAIGLERLIYSNGDFSGIYDGFPGFTGVDQYSYIKVDKDGTEASAVTVGSYGLSMDDSGFVASSPFIYVIHELDSGAILFMGKLNDPRG